VQKGVSGLQKGLCGLQEGLLRRATAGLTAGIKTATAQFNRGERNEKGRRLTGALWGGSYDDVAPSGDLEQSIENSYLLPHEFPADPQQASRYVP
jgi:hypothetical protein